MDSVKPRIISICTKMWRYQPAFGFLISLIYLSLRFLPSNNEGLATRPAEEPSTIASNGSKVYDFYLGNLILRDVVLRDADMALVFYYAPWSKDSMDAFREYEAAAEIMHKQVSFIAVNCWYIKGSCRGKLQFQDFPHIFLHCKKMKNPIHYGGQLKRDYFIHFLEKAIMPLHYISSEQEGHKLIDRNQFSVLAAFKANNLELSKDFQRYAIIATKLLEYAILQIEFGLILNPEIAKTFYMEPGILYVRNRMKPNNIVEISMRNTTDEVVQSLMGLWNDMVCRDLNFPWNRASFLHDSLKDGPLLAVFVSSNSLAERYQYVRKVRQIAMAFYDDVEVNKNYSSIYAKTTIDSTRCCKTYVIEKISPPLTCSVCLKNIWKSHQAKENYADCELKDFFTPNRQIDKIPSLESIHKRVVISPNNAHCIEIQLFYDSKYRHADICCQNKQVFFQDLNKSFTKNNITMRKEALQSVTQRFSVNPKITSLIFAEDLDSKHLHSSAIHGLANVANQTLQFVILDFDHFQALALNFGISEPFIYKHDGTRFGAAIFDPQDEKNYVMKSSEFNLEEFIMNYTLGLLPEHLHSAGEASECIATSTQPCVHEITTDTFDEVVLNNTKNVMLLYYLPWCLACTSMSHNFLYLSDILHGSSTVLFARIDANSNKLPLPFRVEKFPSIILYPANRSSYSVVFPKDKEINIPNLLSFLLKNLSQHSIKLLLLDICINAKDYPDIQHAACRNYKLMGRERSV